MKQIEYKSNNNKKKEKRNMSDPIEVVTQMTSNFPPSQKQKKTRKQKHTLEIEQIVLCV